MSRLTSRRPVAIAAIVCVSLVLGMLIGQVARPPSHLDSLNASGNGLRAADTGSSTTTSTTSASDPSTTTTTTTTPTDPTVPAPSGFADQLINLYGEIYTAATAVPVAGQSQQMEAPDTFDQQVNGLSQGDLNDVYTAASNDPNFGSLTSTFQQADGVAVKAARILKLGASSTKAVHSSTTSSATHAAISLGIHPMALGVQLSVPKALTNYTPTQPVIIYPPPSCPNGAPGINYGETSIFALQVAVDVIAEAVAVIPDGLSTAFGNVTIPNIARIIVAVIQLGVVITHDTFAYLQSVANDCNAIYLANLAGNTDNSAYQTFQELTDVAGTANEIDTNLSALTNQDTSQFQQQLTLAIEQTLSEPAGTVPMAAMELPASLNGYLNSTPVGVNEVVTSTIQAMQKGGQPLSPQASRDETLAEDAFSTNQYKLAFDYFRMAYQAAAS